MNVDNFLNAQESLDTSSPDLENQPQALLKPFGFPPEKRLLSSVEFNRVFKQANHRFRDGFLQVSATSGMHPWSRLGLVIPKKMLKKAVHRNRLKRLVRDEFRRWSSAHSSDVIISLRGKLDPEMLYSRDLNNTIRALFQRLDRYCSKKKSD